LRGTFFFFPDEKDSRPPSTTGKPRPPLPTFLFFSERWPFHLPFRIMKFLPFFRDKAIPCSDECSLLLLLAKVPLPCKEGSDPPSFFEGFFSRNRGLFTNVLADRDVGHPPPSSPLLIVFLFFLKQDAKARGSARLWFPPSDSILSFELNRPAFVTSLWRSLEGLADFLPTML